MQVRWSIASRRQSIIDSNLEWNLNIFSVLKLKPKSDQRKICSPQSSGRTAKSGTCVNKIMNLVGDWLRSHKDQQQSWHGVKRIFGARLKAFDDRLHAAFKCDGTKTVFSDSPAAAAG